jgi:hypothetical protein
MIVRLVRDGQGADHGQLARAGRPGRRLAGPALAAALLTGLAAGVPARAASTQPHSFLASVSCTSSMACLAVGGRAGHEQRDQILALSWNGVRWSPQVPVDVNHTQPNDLNSIACASPAECFAVGSVGSFNFADHRRLIEMWNGTAWSIRAIGNPKGTLNTFLSSVSCGGPSLCLAVGDQNDNTDLTPGVLLEKWSGSNWAVQPPLPEPAGAAGIGIQAVSCVSPSDCTAVGVAALDNFTRQTTLAEHWDGHGWSIEPMPALGSSNQPILTSVSCAGTACMATGTVFTAAGEAALAEVFNGTKWSVVTLAAPAGSNGIAVRGVACTAAANCYAVGGSSTSPGNSVTLIERWNGASWAVVPSPDLAGNVNNTLNGISCASTQSCMAVGRASAGTSQSTVAMRLAAGTWRITPTPSPG